MFKGILLNKTDAGTDAKIADINESDLPEGDVTIRVDYSTINYKDGLAITGKAPVVRKFPMVPGVDGVGTVEESNSALWKVGDKVVLNGWGVGEGHWGCLAQKARLKGEWLVPLPSGFTTKQAASIGTAGYTAMLCVLGLEKHGVTPDKGEILVTGAAGGVGSVAIALLAKRGYTVVASTGRMNEADYLKSLGASEVIDRATLSVTRQTDDERALGRRGRYGRQPYARECLRGDKISRRRHRMWSRARHGFPEQRCAIHFAWRKFGRHRQRDGAESRALGSVGAFGGGSR